MLDTSSTPRPSRRFRFGLRSLFVLVTVASMVTAWATYSLNWIRQRREAFDSLFWDPFGEDDIEITAPSGLWLLGERGHSELWVDDYTKLETARRLFPEAKLVGPFKNAPARE